MLIDSKEERRVKAVINYHNPTNSWPSKIRNGRVDIDGIQDSLKQNIEANAKLKSLQSRDKWWFISGGVFMLLGVIFWTIGHEFERLRKAQAS